MSDELWSVPGHGDARAADLPRLRVFLVANGNDVGRVVAYCPVPSFELERPDGSRFSWRTDMCRMPTALELTRALSAVMDLPKESA